MTKAYDHRLTFNTLTTSSAIAAIQTILHTKPAKHLIIFHVCDVPSVAVYMTTTAAPIPTIPVARRIDPKYDVSPDFQPRPGF